MQLSYTSRLVCLAFCSVGLMQFVLESIAWIAAPYLLQRGGASSARRSEQSFFLLALLARLGPCLMVLGVWLPVYMRGEDNPSPERVGFVAILGAVSVFGWWLLCCSRTLRALIRAQRCCKRCQAAGTSPKGFSVLLYPGGPPFMAAAGVFRPRIIVSQSLLEHLSPAALDIAFTHEEAHVRNWDNLRLVLLSVLPHISLATCKRPSLEQRWRLAAEMAADENGAEGKFGGGVLLAGVLVAIARASSPPMPHESFALLSRAEELRARVDRLLQPQPAAGPNPQAVFSNLGKLQTLCAPALGLVLLAALWVLCMKVGHPAAEALLHLA